MVPFPVTVSVPSLTMGRPTKSEATVMRLPLMSKVSVLPAATVAISLVAMSVMSRVSVTHSPSAASSNAS